MAGRHAKPLKLHILNGNPSHLTKSEIAKREAGEIRMGTHDFKLPPRIKKNSIAKKKWNEVIDIYKSVEADFASTSDTAIIERYCLTYAEYINLQQVREEIEAKGWDKVKTYHAIDELNLENNINKKMDILTKLEDRLFLNPLAKIRNVPKKESEKKVDPLQRAGFGNV